jgi:hypothetical protein
MEYLGYPQVPMMLKVSQIFKKLREDLTLKQKQQLATLRGWLGQVEINMDQLRGMSVVLYKARYREYISRSQ